jgi:hypothetical protein
VIPFGAINQWAASLSDRFHEILKHGGISRRCYVHGIGRAAADVGGQQLILARIEQMPFQPPHSWNQFI